MKNRQGEKFVNDLKFGLKKFKNESIDRIASLQIELETTLNQLRRGRQRLADKYQVLLACASKPTEHIELSTDISTDFQQMYIKISNLAALWMSRGNPQCYSCYGGHEQNFLHKSQNLEFGDEQLEKFN